MCSKLFFDAPISHYFLQFLRFSWLFLKFTKGISLFSSNMFLLCPYFPLFFLASNSSLYYYWSLQRLRYFSSILSSKCSPWTCLYCAPISHYFPRPTIILFIRTKVFLFHSLIQLFFSLNMFTRCFLVPLFPSIFPSSYVFLRYSWNSHKLRYLFLIPSSDMFTRRFLVPLFSTILPGSHISLHNSWNS